ncbi:MAG TPA: PepSY domain-containing protein, partial [Candidatus Elarobacter sp.]|nr:PepSY domain-containing protein [Candidatus Elarobacter sp.]
VTIHPAGDTSMKAAHLTALAVACTLGVASTVMAQATTPATAATKQPTQPTTQPAKGPKTDVPPALAKEAKISLDSARTIAMSKVPNGTIESQELEREHGKLIYSFDVKVAGKSGIDEVNVNAIDGKVIAVSHEGPKAEKREAAQEKKETKKP